MRTRRRRSAAHSTVAEASFEDVPIAATPEADGGSAAASNGAGSVEGSPTEIPAPSDAGVSAAALSDPPGGAGDDGPGQAADGGSVDLATAEPEAPRRTRARRRPARASERASSAKRSERSPEQDDASKIEDGLPVEPVPAAALVDQGSSDPPRRGWWSRFVRKED
jgi:hypothetical protein